MELNKGLTLIGKERHGYRVRCNKCGKDVTRKPKSFHAPCAWCTGRGGFGLTPEQYQALCPPTMTYLGKHSEAGYHQIKCNTCNTIINRTQKTLGQKCAICFHANQRAETVIKKAEKAEALAKKQEIKKQMREADILGRIHESFKLVSEEDSYKFLVKCIKCDYEQVRTGGQLGRPCPSCAGGRVVLSREQLVKKCHSQIEYIEFVGQSKHKVKCRDCHKETLRTSITLHMQCNICRPDWATVGYSDEELQQMCHPKLEFLGRTENCRIKLKCTVCGETKERGAYSLGDACECFSSAFESKGETEILEWVKSLGLEARKLKLKKPILDEYDKVRATSELDIYIPSLNLGIEYNGLWYHTENSISFKMFKKGYSELDKGQKNKVVQYHKEKTAFFQSQGIRVIQIWENEWLNRKDQVKNFILGVFGQGQSIGARKCEFRPIDKKTAIDFCRENHIQGASNSTVYAIGAYCQDRLMMVAAFSPHVRNSEEITLSRMCGVAGVHIVGGLSKVSQMAYEYFKVPIKTWVHKTLSSGQSYVKAGWQVVEESSPDYFYMKGSEAFSKISLRRSSIKSKYPDTYSEDKTESQMAKELKFHRIWDCGKTTLIYPAK